MESNKKQLNEEIHRIREMMGLSLINEISGSGIVDELLKFFKGTSKAADEVSDITKINKGNVIPTVKGLATKNPKLFEEIMDKLVNTLDDSAQKDVRKFYKDLYNFKSSGKEYEETSKFYEELLKSRGVSDEGVIDLFKKDLEIKWGKTPSDISSIPTKPFIQTMTSEQVENAIEMALNNKAITVDENLGFKLDKPKLRAQLKISTGASDSAINKELDLLEKALPNTQEQLNNFVNVIIKRLNTPLPTKPKINLKSFWKFYKELPKITKWGVNIHAGIIAFFITNKLSQGLLTFLGYDDSLSYALLELLAGEISLEQFGEVMKGVRKKTPTSPSTETEPSTGATTYTNDKNGFMKWCKDNNVSGCNYDSEYNEYYDKNLNTYKFENNTWKKYGT